MPDKNKNQKIAFSRSLFWNVRYICSMEYLFPSCPKSSDSLTRTKALVDAWKFTTTIKQTECTVCQIIDTLLIFFLIKI